MTKVEFYTIKLNEQIAKGANPELIKATQQLISRLKNFRRFQNANGYSPLGCCVYSACLDCSVASCFANLWNDCYTAFIQTIETQRVDLTNTLNFSVFSTGCG